MKKYLKAITTIAGIVFLLALSSICTGAVDITQLTFNTNDDGTLCITDCDTNAEGELIIPETIGGRTVTRIGSEAFKSCSKITRVVMPNTITAIDDHAFERTSKMSEIIFSVRLLEIGDYAFFGSGLKKVVFPDNVALGERCFFASDVESIVLPKNLEEIPESCFYGCDNLNEIIWPDNLLKIGVSAFECNWALESLTIPSSVKVIHKYAFASCRSLKSVVIPDSVTTVGGGCFNNCSLLEKVTMGNGCKKLYTILFSNCTSLMSITFTSSILEISDDVFANCPALSDIYYVGTKDQWVTTKVGSGNEAILLANVHYISSFNDVPKTAYYYDAVTWAVKNSITSGVGNNAFAPESTCTNAQVITFLWRAAGCPSPTIDSTLKNVQDSTQYYYNPCVWAYEKGIITDSNFRPNDSSTRSSFVTALYRFEGSPSASYSNKFIDVNGSADYASAVEWAVNKGVTTGTSSSTFSPNSTCTRGQIVTFLYRMFA